MNEKLSFDDWWADFCVQFRGYKDGDNTMLERLFLEVSVFSQQQRHEFIDELLERKNLEVFACYLIPLFGNQNQINEIKTRTIELVDSNITSSILSAYFDAIIKTYTPNDLPLLTKYYLTNHDCFSPKIPTELFEIDKNLFLSSFSKKLKDSSVERICQYDELLYLTKNLNAIEFLINELPAELSQKMKAFAKAKSNHSIIKTNKELREKLLILAGNDY